MRYVDALVRLWHDRIWGPKLQTYDKSRETLGGAPWRAFKNTEHWFLPPAAPPEAMAAAMVGDSLTLDTGALMLARPSLLERLPKPSKSTWLAGAAALMVLALGILVCSGSKSSAPAALASAPLVQAPSVALAQAVPVVAPAPAPVAVAVGPTAHKASGQHMSSSVKALFGNKSSRGSARPTRLKKIRHR